MNGREFFSGFRSGIGWILIFLVTSAAAHASVFGTVRGIVHDPQHRPIADAQVRLSAVHSDWTREARTDPFGAFQFDAVPVGEYRIRISNPGFSDLEQQFELRSSGAPVMHFAMQVVSVRETLVVSAGSEQLSTGSASTGQLVNRLAIEETPGASRTSSLALITNYVPGAYIVHDQLHVRGGHQTSWLVDGVPVPNTNIASNVGPQFDPKDIEYLEIQRGGLSAEFGDRTYAVFNVVPRNGFERNNEGELQISFGSLQQSNEYLSFGSHTNRLAYYVSLNGNRTDLGLQPPTPDVLHALADGLGGFGSLTWNAAAADQLRLAASLRRNFFQVPNSPADQAAGTRDAQKERDGFINFSWVRTFSSGVLLMVSPFYHYNRAAFAGGPNDFPLTTADDRTSHYGGGQLTFSVARGKHNARMGLYGYAQRDSQLFGLVANDGSGTKFSQRVRPRGQLEALFAEDQFKPVDWFSVSGGVRVTHFAGSISKSLADPRLGASLRIPKLGWVARAAYSRAFQSPPLETLSGTVLLFAANNGASFVPLNGERDEQTELGLTIPFHGWTADFAHFHSRARNFFDHDVLGNSNIFVPLTIETTRIRGAELTLRSPQFLRSSHFHLAYSRQTAQGRGGITGGLISGGPGGPDYFFLDHDQRHTLSAGLETHLPWRTTFSANVAYGSGFLDGDGPQHLPSHTTADFALSKSLGESLTLGLTVLNLTNQRFLLDNSNTFGGTHFNFPREIIGTIRFRFHY